MKHLLLIILFSSLFSFSKVNHDIIGSWQANIGGVAGTIRYKKDNTFDVFANKKTFATGKYTFNNDTLTYEEDNGCINKDGVILKGVYKVNFISADSIQYEVVYNSCGGRKDGLNHLKMAKIEKVSK